MKRDPRNSQRSHTGQSLLCCLHSTITHNYSNNHSLVEGEDSVALICEPEIQDITYPVVNQWSEPLRGWQARLSESNRTHSECPEDSHRTLLVWNMEHSEGKTIWPSQPVS